MHNSHRRGFRPLTSLILMRLAHTKAVPGSGVPSHSKRHEHRTVRVRVVDRARYACVRMYFRCFVFCILYFVFCDLFFSSFLQIYDPRARAFALQHRFKSRALNLAWMTTEATCCQLCKIIECENANIALQHQHISMPGRACCFGSRCAQPHQNANTQTNIFACIYAPTRAAIH